MRTENLPVFIVLLLASPTFARNTKYNASSSPSSIEIGADTNGQEVQNTLTPTEAKTKELAKAETNPTRTPGTSDDVTTHHGAAGFGVNNSEQESTTARILKSDNGAVTSSSRITSGNNQSVKFIPVGKDLTNVSKNGAIENNLSAKNKPVPYPVRRDLGHLESQEKGAGIESEFMKVSTMNGKASSKTFPRTLNPYRETPDNLSKILLYPINGTTAVYRETTFKPILPDGLIKKTVDANNGQDDSYLPLSTWSRMAAEDIDVRKPDDERHTPANENLESIDADVIEATNFGLEAMNNLYYITEPKLFSMGLFLTDDNPARYVAAFNDQSEEARQLARFGFAALESAKSFVSKHPKISRTETLIKTTRRTALHRQCPRRGIPPCPPASLRYRTSDGSCNNPNELWWGSAMSAMQRLLNAAYDDGIQSIRRSTNGTLLPSAREISSFIHQDHDIPLASVTHMLMQWGQFVDHDVTATGQGRAFNGTVPQCCLNGGGSFQPPDFMHPECLPIPVPATDRFYGPLGVRCLEFVRSGPAPREDCGFGPRDQLSGVTSYLDASTVYGSNVQTSDSLRLFRNGLLQYGKIQSRKPLLPRQGSDLCRRGSLDTNCFRAGDGRLTEQPALISLHVIFLRQHNRIATELAALNPHWSDEKLFQETRRIIGAIVQHITYREFLPIVLGPEVIKAFDLEIKRKGYYEGYDSTVNPNIANAFAAAAYRFGHSLVQRSFVRYDTNHRPIFNNVTIHDEFNNPVNLHTVGALDRLLLGLINQPSQKRDEFITEELTNHLFETPGFGFGMDLASLNIQRGRDHGLPPYVDWREPCGLSPVRIWEDLNRVMPASVAKKFRFLYSSVEDIDLFPAGLSEKPVPGGLVGPTFACIIAQQFSNLRKGDRFWYENPNRESSFTAAQLQQIKRITLAQILCKSTESIETIQPFVFLTPDTARNDRIPCDTEIIGTFNLDPWAERLPPEQRTKHRKRTRISSTIRKENRGNNHLKDETNDSNSQAELISPTVEHESAEAQARVSSEEKSFFPFFKPVRTGVNQQNKVVIRRPLDTHENLTILVQNHAVNSPVFVSDSIKGSNFQFTQSNDDRYKPNHVSTARPIERPVTYDDWYTSPRPIYYDDTEPNPVSIPQMTYRPVPRPKPKPQSKPSGYGNPTSHPRPYIPQGFNDPSNPNPPNYGFASRPTNNYAPSNSFFDAFPATTTQRPTLYTFYTTYKKPIPTQRPDPYYYEQNRPQSDKNQYHQYQQHDSFSESQGYHEPSNPSTPSYSVVKPIHEADDQIVPQKPIYDQSWTSDTTYEYSWNSRPSQSDTGGWADVSVEPLVKPSYGKPSQTRPASPPSRPDGGYWTEYSATTKKYLTPHHYYDTEYQIHNAEANINPRPFKKQGVSIITEIDNGSHYPSKQRQPVQNERDIPKPLHQVGRDHPADVAEHKNTYEIELIHQISDERKRPGQLYYEKNVLHRYPDENLTAIKDISNGYVNAPYDLNKNIGSYKNKHDGIIVDRIIFDSKYQIEKLDPNRGGGPGPTADVETKAQVSRDEPKLTTTATIVLEEPDNEYYDGGDDYDDDEGEEMVGAYSEKSEHFVASDILTSHIEWINVNENSSLTSNPEMPNLVSDGLVGTREIPKPLEQRKPAS
ncbi:uncharacterized protein LOC124300423 isoform X1 [Neodiprion virginianus]|uniref:uncharacterized protein LOC124300423 isoform X1 n=2 Tax=Neodiprion virginianus TaxID=2961670 RepID=UPI001EE7146C|nr:uncharacterized protein LOC124300423 isoform X1 [Neodiprion virginianus]